MGVMPLVVAAFGPIVTLANAVPTYKQQRSLLATYLGLLGFSAVALVFYCRPILAKGMFGPLLSDKKAGARSPTFGSTLALIYTYLLPLVLLLGSILQFMSYDATLEDSLVVTQTRIFLRSSPKDDEGVHTDEKKDLDWMRAFIANGKNTLNLPTRKDALYQSDYTVPFGASLEFRYISAFLLLELAFVVMALKEYLQDLLDISELELLRI